MPKLLNQDIKIHVAELAKLKEKLGQVEIDLINGKSKNMHEPRNIRKQIAASLTKMHQLSYKNAKNS